MPLSLPIYRVRQPKTDRKSETKRFFAPKDLTKHRVYDKVNIYAALCLSEEEKGGGQNLKRRYFMKKVLSAIISGILVIVLLSSCSVRKYLFGNSGFTNGFAVRSQLRSDGSYEDLGTFPENSASPEWILAQWNSGPCLWDDRVDTGDPNVLTDGKVKTVTYDPVQDSVSLRLNAAGYYDGAPAGEDAWPHLLLENTSSSDFFDDSPLSAGKYVVSGDLRLADFKPDCVGEGVSAAEFLIFLYVRATDGPEFVWFGMRIFDSRGLQPTNWQHDIASGCMIYALSTVDSMGGRTNALRLKTTKEWTHFEVDLTPHIKKLVNQINESGVFGRQITADDLCFTGTNIGWEIHGSFDCAMEIKNYKLTRYPS